MTGNIIHSHGGNSQTGCLALAAMWIDLIGRCGLQIQKREPIKNIRIASNFTNDLN